MFLLRFLELFVLLTLAFFAGCVTAGVRGNTAQLGFVSEAIMSEEGIGSFSLCW